MLFLTRYKNYDASDKLFNKFIQTHNLTSMNGTRRITELYYPYSYYDLTLCVKKIPKWKKFFSIQINE